MCEFNVVLGRKNPVQRRNLSPRVEGDNVTVKNILGEAMEFKGCRIVDVDVPNTRMVLARTK